MSSPAPLPEHQKTEVLYGMENAVARGVEFMRNVTERMDIYFDRRVPSIITKTEAYRDGYLGILRRGGKIRCLTDITSENLADCKELLGMVTELRHFSGLKGGIAVNGHEYMATAILEQAEPLTEVIYSTLKAEVEQGQFIFDTLLWERAIPAQRRIRELEEGTEPEVFDTLDSSKVESLESELVKSAKQEILILFSTANAYNRHELSGLLRNVREVASRSKVKVRILTPAWQNDSDNTAKWKSLESESSSDGADLRLRFIDAPLQTKISLFIIDRSKSLAFEVRDDSKMIIREAIGVAVYSNSTATVSSFSTIFNALWTQTELYEEIRELFEQLQIQLRMQKEFINIAAHELRTPIQPILGLAEVIGDRMSELDFGQHRKMMEVIIRNARRLKQLQEDILDVTKIEGHMLNLEKTEFSLNEVITEAIEDLKHDSKSDVSVVFNPREELVLSADRMRISQVIANLLSNAIKFTESGTVLVELGRDSSRKEAIVKLKDTGEGIDPKIIPRLFTKFASKSGTGLGLYISRSIVEAHGGSIWAENNADGKGATFYVRLPL